MYQARKEQLGCHIDDVREVMPHCVIKVRERYTEEQEAQFIVSSKKRTNFFLENWLGKRRTHDLRCISYCRFLEGEQ